MAKKLSKFDDFFSEVVGFTPDGFYLSKSLFSQEEALEEFKKYLEEKEIVLSEVEYGFVRFQFTPNELRADGVSDVAWITCKKEDRNSQPCWVYGL